MHREIHTQTHTHTDTHTQTTWEICLCIPAEAAREADVTFISLYAEKRPNSLIYLHPKSSFIFRDNG